MINLGMTGERIIQVIRLFPLFTFFMFILIYLLNRTYLSLKSNRNLAGLKLNFSKPVQFLFKTKNFFPWHIIYLWH